MSTVAFISCGQAVGKSFRQRLMLDFLREQGHTIIELKPSRIITDDPVCPRVEQRSEPDWERKKYFGNRRKKR